MTCTQTSPDYSLFSDAQKDNGKLHLPLQTAPSFGTLLLQTRSQCNIFRETIYFFTVFSHQVSYYDGPGRCRRTVLFKMYIITGQNKTTTRQNRSFWADEDISFSSIYYQPIPKIYRYNCASIIDVSNVYSCVFSSYSKLSLSSMISTNINKRKQPKLIINTASFCISDAPVRTFFFLAVQSLHNHNALEEQIQLNSCLKKKKKKETEVDFSFQGGYFVSFA